MLKHIFSQLHYLNPPVLARNTAELSLQRQAHAHSFTQFDLAMAIGLLADFLLSLLASQTHWYSIYLVELALSLYLFTLLFSSNFRPLLTRLLLASLLTGICELFTDAAGQSVAHSLIYPPSEPMLWTSPIYMPFSWMTILTLLGYLSWRLRALLGGWKSILICGLFGAIQIPLFEEMAYYGDWWRYRPTHLMLGHTPLYVLLFEGLIVASLPILYNCLERRSWPQVALIGLLLGLWLPFAALFSWLLLGL